MKKKIFFVLDDFSEGGAARVISIIGSELQTRGYEVSFLMDTSKECIYNLHPDINIIPFFNTKETSFFKRLWTYSLRLRKLIKKERGIWISALPSMALILWLSCIGLNVKKIASDHTSFERKLSRFAHFIRYRIYSRFDAVTILTQADYKYLGNRLPKKVVMPNPISGEYYDDYEIRDNIVLAAGRLDVWYEKGFDILLEAWSKVSLTHPDWILQIAGSGKELSYQYLLSLIKNLNIERTVRLLGQQRDIKSVMRKASIFALTSRVEGFGLVLVEAMSQGCACISFDCGGRQKEIIESFEQGIIIEKFDSDLLAQQLERLIENKSLRESLSTNGCGKSKCFDKKVITDLWENLINQI